MCGRLGTWAELSAKSGIYPSRQTLAAFWGKIFDSGPFSLSFLHFSPLPFTCAMDQILTSPIASLDNLCFPKGEGLGLERNSSTQEWWSPEALSAPRHRQSWAVWYSPRPPCRCVRLWVCLAGGCKEGKVESRGSIQPG